MSWGNPKSLAENALVKMLWPASFGYGGASYLRMMAYNAGIARQSYFNASIISVGNITVGGTGKTPVTIDFAKRLVAAGKKVAVLSRGYKRLSKEKLLVVSDGRGALASCAESGDEPYLIASTVPEAVVIVGSQRVVTAELAVNKFLCDTILLDDGFQHLPIARDTDIVLVDYNDQLENDHLLPAGRLREPLSALSRADYVVITKVPQNADQARLANLRALIAKNAPRAAITACRMTADTLSPFGCPDITLGNAVLKGTRVFAFCAIARPELFFRQLEAMGAQLVGTKAFADHRWYTHADLESLKEQALSAQAEMIITTEKDSVKLFPNAVKDISLSVVRQQVQWLGTIPSLITRPSKQLV